MADLTHGAVDSLVGLLSMAIKNEAKLLGGVEGDLQFIKDEMESMNGFLLHLTKTDVEHDDQLRAWMKQVRDIAYIAQDCIELYMRGYTPPEKGFWGFLQHLPMLLSTIPTRHRVANNISELKVRVREVGERRMRYDVSVPRDAKLKQQAAGNQDSQAEIVSARAEFLRALAHDKKSQQELNFWRRAFLPLSFLFIRYRPSFSQAIALLPSELRPNADTISASLQQRRCSRDDHDICMEMLLRAFHAYPQGRRTKTDLEKLLKAAADADADLPREVMVFCYSKLSTHYKSCLQYLAAFSEESSISRTSLVRRWVAEGLVDILWNQTHEEAAEHCFGELLFRGFLLHCDMGAGGKVKSCTFDGAVKRFVMDMSGSENFVSHLPTHLDNQVSIRKIVNRRDEDDRISSSVDGTRRRSTCGELICVPSRDNDGIIGGDNARMDEMVKLLKSMPLTYRLNVLDLGGCRGLNRKGRLLRSIWDCKVVLLLKYLSLRNTDVKRLPRQINKLQWLETLDIRQTSVKHSDTEHIYLPKLRHLLAADVVPASGAVRMPHKIKTMRDMEILSHVEVSPKGGGATEFDEVGNLPKLRKLGVVLDTSKDNIKHLLRAMSNLKGCLRSLSIIFPVPATTNGGEGVPMELGPTEQRPALLESLSITGHLAGAMLPAWIHELKKLTKITLCHTSLSIVSLQLLGKQLPALRCLRLRRHSYSERKLAFGKDEFKALEFLEVEGDTIDCIAFDEEDGSAPPAAALEKIVWKSPAATVDAFQGINRLPRLQVVELINETSHVRFLSLRME